MTVVEMAKYVEAKEDFNTESFIFITLYYSE